MTHDDFALILDNCEKLDLIDIQRDLAGTAPKIHVVDESEHRYGEPGTLILIVLAGNLALPPLLVWLARHKKGFTLEERNDTVLPDGTRVKSSLKVSVTKSGPPDPERLKVLAKFPGVDPVKIAEAYSAGRLPRGNPPS